MAHVARDGSGSSDRPDDRRTEVPWTSQPPSRYDAVVEGFPRSADALSCNLVEGSSVNTCNRDGMRQVGDNRASS